jgi:hypothetical protein
VVWQRKQWKRALCGVHAQQASRNYPASSDLFELNRNCRFRTTKPDSRESCSVRGPHSSYTYGAALRGKHRRFGDVGFLA